MPRQRKSVDGVAPRVLHSLRRSLWARRAAVIGGVAVVSGAIAFQSVGQEHRTLTFATRPSRLEVSPDGRELLLIFHSAMPDGEAERAAHALGPLLEGYAEGYGAVRFRVSAPVRATLATDRSVDVVVEADQTGSPEDRRRLALLEAREQARGGDLAGAEVRLRQMSIERPGDIEPMLTLAEAEAASSRWRTALGLYDGVLRLFPQATDIVRERDGLARRNGPVVRLTGNATFGPNGERAQTAVMSTEFPLAEGWRAGASFQTTHDEIRGLRRSGSATTSDFSGTKLLGTVSLTHDWSAPGSTTRVDLFAAPQTLGVSLKQEWKTQLGLTTLGGVYHQPYWGTVMSFAANAWRDQAGFAQTVPLGDDWEASIGAGVVRYGLPGHDDVANGPSVLAGISRALPEAWIPVTGLRVRAGYRMEGEYLSSVQTGPTASGFLPLLDVRRREFHSLYTEGSLPIGAGTGTALVGYAQDRFGGGGPQALLRLSGGDDASLGYSAEAGVEPSLDVKPRTLFHVGGSLVWRFGS